MSAPQEHTISPPPTSATPSDPSQQQPISPIHRTSTFPHRTSPAVATQTPLIDTATPAINDTPVELDGVSMSTEELKRRATGDSLKAGGAGGGSSSGREGSGSGNMGVMSPADEEDIDGEFLGEGGEGNAGEGVRAKRAAMLASRSKDPGVIVDVPQDPTAEEVEAAKSAEGTVTPALPTPGLESKNL